MLGANSELIPISISDTANAIPIPNANARHIAMIEAAGDAKRKTYNAPPSLPPPFPHSHSLYASYALLKF